jgi:hypothetical protein
MDGPCTLAANAETKKINTSFVTFQSEEKKKKYGIHLRKTPFLHSL